MFKIIFPVFLIAGAIGGFYFFTNPTYQEIKSLETEKKSYQDALDNSKKLQEARDTLLNRYNSFPSPSIDRLEKMLPNNVDNVRLVLEIDQMAAKYGMSIKNIKFSGNDVGNEKDLIGTKDSLYGTLTLDFTIAGYYPAFVAFISDLEKSLRIVDVDEITFSSPDDERAFTQYGVRIKTYWLK